MQKSSQSVIFTDFVLLNPPAEVFSGTTVLSRAIKTGTIKEVNVLLEKGCDPNLSCGTWGMRPLMVAQYITKKKRRQQIVRLLLQFGAVPSLVDNQRRNCLMYACALQASESVSMMLQAVEYNFYDTDCDGNTLLHVCSMVGNLDVLKTVLQYGLGYRCNLNTQNKLCLTALMVAVLRQRKDCFALLHDNGGIPRFTTDDFCSVLATMEESPLASVSANDLLSQILADSESVADQAQTHLDWYHKILTSSMAKNQSHQPLQHQTALEVADDGPYKSHHTTTIDQQPDRCSTNTEVVRQKSVAQRNASLKSELQTLSYMASIEDLLARPYHVRRSASYHCPQVDRHEVNKEWMDIIRKYCYDEKHQCDTMPVEATAKTQSQLFSTISSPSGTRIQPTYPTSLHQSSSNRHRSLSRSTTSPHIFTHFSAIRKPMADKDDCT